MTHEQRIEAIKVLSKLLVKKNSANAVSDFEKVLLAKLKILISDL